MLRTKCPFCDNEVMDNDKAGRIVNGRGIFKTTILYHKSCYDEFVTYRRGSSLFKEIINENSYETKKNKKKNH